MNGEQEPQAEAQQADVSAHKGERGPNQQVLIVSDKGYGIRVSLSEFRKAHRGTKGTRAMFLNEKNGHIIGAKIVKEGDTVTILTKNGQAGLFGIDEIKLKGRGISGVRLMTLADDDVAVAVV